MNDKSCYCNKYIETCKLKPSELCPSELASPRELLEDASRRSTIIYEQLVDLMKIDCECGEYANLPKLIINNMVNLERLLFTISTKISPTDFVCNEPSELIRASAFLRTLIPSLNFIAGNGICESENCPDVFFTLRLIIADFSVNVAAIIDLLNFSYIGPIAEKNMGGTSPVRMPSVLNRFNGNTQVCSQPTCCNPTNIPVACVDPNFSKLLLVTLSLSLNTDRILTELFIDGAVFRPEPLCREVVRILYTDFESIKINAEYLLAKIANVNFVCKKSVIALDLIEVANLSRFIINNLKYVEYLMVSEDDFDRCRAGKLFALLVSISGIITTILATVEATAVIANTVKSSPANNMRTFSNSRSYSMEVL